MNSKLSIDPAWPDPVKEMVRLVSICEQKGTRLRAFGSTAVWHHCPASTAWLASRGRRIKDIDLVCDAASVKAVVLALLREGYAEDAYTARFSAQWQRRFCRDEWRVDLCIGSLTFCHKFDISKRLNLDYPTLPLADLVLSKLQNVRLTMSDCVDVVALCEEHDLADSTEDEEYIDVARLVEVLRRDWGFYTTVADNLGQILEDRESYPGCSRALDRLVQINRELVNSNKSLKWWMRSVLGRRVAWYGSVE